MSAKTGEKVYDTIKNFGMKIVKSKMEGKGMAWSTPSSSKPEPKTSQKEEVSFTPTPTSSTSGGPKSGSTMQLKSNPKKGAVPGYKKQCC